MKQNSEQDNVDLSVSASRLRRLRKSSLPVKLLTRDLACSGRNKWEITADWMSRRYRISRREAVLSLKQLEGTGIGRFVKGRSPYPTRLLCQQPLALVSALALDAAELGTGSQTAVRRN